MQPHPGQPAPGFDLDERYTRTDGTVYLTGMQALLRLLLDQRRLDQRNGLNTAGFVCGYPGSPVGGVDGEMQRQRDLLAQHHIVHKQGLNEELAATAAFGTQLLHTVPGARYDGVFAMWFGKAPGVDRSGDALNHANFRGTGRHGGVLVVAGDDPHARSTIFPSDSTAAFYKFMMPVLAPGNIQEVLDYGQHGFALSRASGLYVGFKLVTDVADSAAIAVVGRERMQPKIPEVIHEDRPFHPTLRVNDVAGALVEAERVMVEAQLEVARRYAALNGLNRIVLDPPQASIGIVAGGKTWYDLRQALDDLGLSDASLRASGIRLLKIGMLFPLEPEIVRRFARGLDEIVVVEDKRPFLELFIKDLLYAEAVRPRVVGKRDEDGGILLPVNGELSPDQIARALIARLGPLVRHPDNLAGRARAAHLATPAAAPAPLSTARMPYFCSGCPHNSSLKAPEGAIVGAGIGCHIMALWMTKGYGKVLGHTQMGGEGAQWVGLAPFTDTAHFFQNLGDGTFAHSGHLALRFAVAEGANVTYKLLVNSTVAMTGGQDIEGGLDVPAMVKLLEAERVARIIVTTDEPERYAGGRVAGAEVWPRERLLEAQELLARTPGVTVLLHEQMCATQKRRLRKRARMAYRPVSAFINERVCEGCGDCGEKSNCLSVQPVATEFGRKTRIHQSSCNQDLSCLRGDCPSFLTVEAAVIERRDRAARDLPLPADFVLPEPAFIVPHERFSVCLMGVGGTGVVTVNQVLGTAAFLAGQQVQGYDHTGSSQKAGPVISHLKVVPPGTDAAPTVGSGSADLYLGFDPLVAASAANLALAAPARTVAIVSTTAIPTGEMVADRNKRFPLATELRTRIDAVTRREANRWLDAQALAEGLLGDHMASNFFLVGVAWQCGALPIPAASIEQAITLNGVAVRMNLQAFRWGRAWVADRERVEAIARDGGRAQRAVLAGAPALPAHVAAWISEGIDAEAVELRRLVGVRAGELIGYQDEALARRYVQQVVALRRAEHAALGARTAFSEAAARALHQLLAVKDEYEVARLLLDQGERARLQEAFGEGARVWYNLHPSWLRALGVQRKIRLGAWFTPVLRFLRRVRWLRATSIDPFARTHERRVERALAEHFARLLQRAADGLDASGYAAAVALAGLPEEVRGYGPVKLRSVVHCLAGLQDKAAALGIDAPLPPILRALCAPAPVKTPAQFVETDDAGGRARA